MINLIFATNNLHKIQEIRTQIPVQFNIITLSEAGINIDIPEPHATLEANATEKSRTIFALTGQNCFSEDTGLEVAALNGEPGVRSARYSGDNASSDENINKLMDNLTGVKDRSARFRTIISLQLDGKEYLFEGICEGTIITERKGEGGFGYDPVFIPDGAEKTFGQMALREKTAYSHRAKAVTKLACFLSHFYKS